MEIKMIKTGLLQENTYIISKGNECLVVDPGSELNKINEYLNAKQSKGLDKPCFIIILIFTIINFP